MHVALDRLRRCNLKADLECLTLTGGRLVGSASEANALSWLRGRLRRIPEICFAEHRFLYQDWQSDPFSIGLADNPACQFKCHPLYWSAPTPPDGLIAKVADLGRGSEEDFRSVGGDVSGKIVVVRHEYPFASDTVHRSLKYKWSCSYGACGFIVANYIAGEVLVTGSCGTDSPSNIPAVGVSMETGDELVRLAKSSQWIRLHGTTSRARNAGINLLAEVSGQTSEWIVVCAHYDGHDLAQSAIDNASGVATAINIFEAFAPDVPKSPRGLRLILFTAEESGLRGSQAYVDQMTVKERRNISLVVNLDVLAGSSRLTCLTSNFEELDAFVDAASAKTESGLRCHRPLLRNSDHFSFAQAGIPALRLVAGFGEPSSQVRYLLSNRDTIDAIAFSDLENAAVTAGKLIWSALNWPERISEHKHN